MNVLKRLGLSLLSFILFLSLAVFSLVYMVDNTILDADFVTAEVNRLDVPALFDEFFEGEFDSAADIRIEIAPGNMISVDINEPLNRAIDETVIDLEPWLKEEADSIIHSSYDYLLGETEDLNIVIATNQIEDTFSENLIDEILLVLPTTELQGITEADIRQSINEAYDQEIAGFIPATYEITENDIPDDIMDNLETARFWLDIYDALYWGLIGLMAICVLGIILISRKLTEITNTLGIPLFTYGLVGYIIILVAKLQGWTEIPVTGISAPLQEWISQFANNLLEPVQIFNLAIMITGAVLLIVSFVYPRLRPSSTSQPD